MRSFYHYMMRYRGNKQNDGEKQLADWMFGDHSFPKQATSYDEVSRYLEWNIPFPEALAVFDRVWTQYEIEELDE
ncbi:sterile alpha motif-like domain-containing protein [Thalassobacillus sp. CUG 92003]|uniref:YozE family protein n=1 Tax=Thalassobacillus sp. CUG 92003 TaxID=2736641 RepID=UPI0015E6F1EB